MNLNQYDKLLVGKMGSHSYGTQTPTSDIDLMGVVIPKPAKFYYHGLYTFGNSDTVDHKTEKIDAHYYEIRKFCGLAAKGNANVLPLLWLKGEHYENITIQGSELIRSRDLFLSKKIYHTFCGYAAAQQKRMLGENTGQLGQKRKELVEKYGYDTKFAFHTIRLLTMCYETLNDGTLYVYRTYDKQTLLDIRNGLYSIKEILEMVKDLEFVCEESYKQTSLPENPDWENINKLVTQLIGDYIQ